MLGYDCPNGCYEGSLPTTSGDCEIICPMCGVTTTPCPDLIGACCRGRCGDCSLETEANCDGQYDSYLGDDTTCGEHTGQGGCYLACPNCPDPPHTGACCAGWPGSDICWGNACAAYPNDEPCGGGGSGWYVEGCFCSDGSAACCVPP